MVRVAISSSVTVLTELIDVWEAEQEARRQFLAAYEGFTGEQLDGYQQLAWWPKTWAGETSVRRVWVHGSFHYLDRDPARMEDRQDRSEDVKTTT